MKKTNQQRIAGWTEGWAAASLCLPVVGVIAVLGFGEAFWIRCTALVILAALVFWILAGIRKKRFKHPKIGWLVCFTYFTLAVTLVAATFGSFTLASVIGFPEVVGGALSIWGLVDAAKRRGMKEDSDQSSHRTSAIAPR